MEREIEKKIKEILKKVRENELYPEISIVTDGISSKPEFFREEEKNIIFLPG